MGIIFYVCPKMCLKIRMFQNIFGEGIKTMNLLDFKICL